MATLIFLAVLAGIIISGAVQYPESIKGCLYALIPTLLIFCIAYYADKLSNPALALGVLQTIYFVIFLVRMYVCNYLHKQEAPLCIVRALWGFILSDVFLYATIVIYRLLWLWQ